MAAPGPTAAAPVELILDDATAARCQPEPLIESVALIIGGGTSGTDFDFEQALMMLETPLG